MPIIQNKSLRVISSHNSPLANHAIHGLEGWTGIDVNLTLPKAGIYQVYFNLTVSYSNNGGFDNHWINGRLFNVTKNDVIGRTTCFLVAVENLSQNGDLFYRQGVINVTMNVTEQTTIQLQAICHSVIANAFLQAEYSNFGYIGFV